MTMDVKCWQALGSNGKAESPFVTSFMERLFEGKDASEFDALACVGINPYRRRERETDMILLLSWSRESRERYTVQRTDVITKKVTSGNDEKRSVTLEAYDSIKLHHVIVNIEIKSHDAHGLQFTGESLYVRYDDTWHNATGKLIEQGHSAKKFLTSQFKLRADYVTSLIYLPNVTKADLSCVLQRAGIAV